MINYPQVLAIFLMNPIACIIYDSVRKVCIQSYCAYLTLVQLGTKSPLLPNFLFENKKRQLKKNSLSTASMSLLTMGTYLKLCHENRWKNHLAG